MKIRVEPRTTYSRSRWFNIKRAILSLDETSQVRIKGLTRADVHILRSNLSGWQKIHFARRVTVRVVGKDVIITLRTPSESGPELSIEPRGEGHA